MQVTGTDLHTDSCLLHIAAAATSANAAIAAAFLLFIANRSIFMTALKLQYNDAIYRTDLNCVLVFLQYKYLFLKRWHSFITSCQTLENNIIYMQQVPG